MKITLSDKIIAYLALFSGLTISAVAVWYSVAGLVSIFAAAVVPIIVMGVALEVSKLIATVWLKLNWQRAPMFIKTYMTAAVIVLMIITSMGIFGFLSKAHSDQSLVSGDVMSRISIYDEKIKTAKDNIDANRKALKQMDEAVDQVMGRSSDEKGADKAVAVRRSQQKERARLQSEIQAEQKIVTAVSEERAPIAAEVRKVEAEVGPIKYIAAFVYGDNPDANVLEKAVTWVIIIIVSVFDPLAVILLLASQYSFQWFRKAREDEEANSPRETTEVVDSKPLTVEPEYEPDDGALTDDQIKQINEMLAEHAVVLETEIPTHTEEVPSETPLTALGGDITAPEPQTEEEPLDQENEAKAEDDIIRAAAANEKEAMTRWKAENPSGSLKHQRLLLERGIISVLPWTQYLKAEPDFTDNDAALEAAKWAAEQLAMHDAERPGDYITKPEEIGYMENVDGQQVKKIIEGGYTQNAEQNESTLWKRVQDAKK